MTISMPDSIHVPDLPAGYPAYLGYADGAWPTAGELARRFPAARRVILTVTGDTLDCDGIDVEPGDVAAATAAYWTGSKLDAAPHSRPVIYASVVGQLGYGMHEIIDALTRGGIPLSSVRLLSAHYGAGEHICGPATCDLIGRPMDGTQWTDAYRTPAGATVDMSLLNPGFFGAQQTETEKIVQELGIVRQGDTGKNASTVQGLCVARGYRITVDGVFGSETEKAVRALQIHGLIPDDGIVGPQTWPVLLGIA